MHKNLMGVQLSPVHQRRKMYKQICSMKSRKSKVGGELKFRGGVIQEVNCW